MKSRTQRLGAVAPKSRPTGFSSREALQIGVRPLEPTSLTDPPVPSPNVGLLAVGLRGAGIGFSRP